MSDQYSKPQVVEDGARDERLAEEVRIRLQQHPMVDASRVSVQAVNCEVFLLGTADNRSSVSAPRLWRGKWKV